MKVRIYQPAKTTTQSGKKNRSWFLEPIAEEQHKSINDLMGWTSSNNTLMQLKLSFTSQESAVLYAKNQGWEYKIIEPNFPKIIKKSYTDNFI